MSFSVWGRFSLFGVVTAGIIFLLDQLSKYWIIHLFWPAQGCAPLDQALSYKCRFVVTPFMDLTMAWNKGVSYGLFAQHSDMGRYLLIGFSVLAMIGFFIWLGSVTGRFLALGIGLVIGGAAGNMLDRINYEAVADFVSLHAFGYYWYIFNVADVAIVAGAAVLLYDLTFHDAKTKTVTNG